MSVERYVLGVVELDGKLYVVGGYNSQNQALDSMECYDPDSNSWGSKAPLLQKIREFGVNGTKFRISSVNQMRF